MSTKKYYYVYRISNIVENKHYYGKRSCSVEPELDLGIRYFSSSKDKEFIKDQKENPKHYEYVIVLKCDTEEEASTMEVYLHDYFNVGVNPKFYNRAKQTSTKFTTSGLIRSQEQIDRHRKALIGRKFTQAHKDKIGNSRKGEKHPLFGTKASPSTREKQSKAHKGINNASAKLADVYDYTTKELIATNVVLSCWCVENGYSQSALSITTRYNPELPYSSSNRSHHKGIFARYKEII